MPQLPQTHVKLTFTMLLDLALSYHVGKYSFCYCPKQYLMAQSCRQTHTHIQTIKVVQLNKKLGEKWKRQLKLLIITCYELNCILPKTHMLKF